MRRIICDKCERFIQEEQDVRYLGISKFVKDAEKPVMPTLEICTMCSTRIEQVIRSYNGKA